MAKRKGPNFIECFKCGKEITGDSIVMDINPDTGELGKLPVECIYLHKNLN